MTTLSGFDGTKQQTSQITAVLHDIASLIDAKLDNAVEIRLATNGCSIVPGLNMANEAGELKALVNDLNEGIFTLLVAGTFKNGKSTLINAMLGDKSLPAGAAPTTGVITLLVYGESDLVQVYKYDRVEPEVLTREVFFEEYRLKTEDATDSTDELQQPRFQNVKYARMECRHPICAKGVRLVDSPGLGEHTARSELTTNFLKQSQAVIFVLNAIALFSKEERDFIRNHLGEGRLDHVFFPVNRVNQVENVEELQQRARKILHHNFLDKQDRFDQEHYASRVFWVNAQGALKARQRIPPDNTLLTNSGVAAFEQHLEEFLTDEKMFGATLASALQTVQPMVRNALAFIAAQKKTLHDPVETLRKRRDGVEERLRALEIRVNDIEMIIQQRGEKVQYQLEIGLQKFLDEIQADFERELDTLVAAEAMKKISLGTVAWSGLSTNAQQKIAEAVKTVISEYIKVKFDAWSEQATDQAKTEVDELYKQLDASIKQFSLQLAQARGEFLGSDEKKIIEQQQDISISVSSRLLLGGQGVGGIIGGSVRRLFIVIAILSLGTLSVFGWILLIGAILADLGIIIGDPIRFKRELLTRTFTTILDNIRADLNSENFTTNNLRSSFVLAVRRGGRILDRVLWEEFGPDLRKTLGERIQDQQSEIDEGKFEQVRSQLLEQLNQLITKPLYTSIRFEQVSLADETERLLHQQPVKDLTVLNRNLLVDAYPDHLTLKLKDSLSRAVRMEFIKVSRQVTGKMRAQIEQLRKQMDGIIAELEKEEDSAKKELTRQDAIATQLLALFNVISQAANQRSYTLDELLPNSEAQK